MRVVFMGTPDFAVPCLEALINADYDVIGTFTQPDKPKGRGYTLAPPPVKVTALEHNIPVFQPKTLKDGDALNILKELAPDCIVVVAYGKILPKAILDLPKYGCINVHASLLPKYRGAAPIQWSVLNGEAETGVTSMYMDEGLDTGDMIMKRSCKIDENETAGQLHDKLSQLGASIIVDTLTALENGTAKREKQNDSDSCYSPMLDKSLCQINWSDTAKQVHNKVRGLSPWPVAIASINGKKVKIHQTRLSDKQGTPGEIIATSPLTVACGCGSVIIDELQLEGKKRMDSQSFLNGHKLNIGDKFQ
ncbi:MULTISPECIES: methionyl-tRNA formyltransferase [unclassified Ruminococcus]|uniref:methionyl-tRNA formyltransferase n=1 Tax=unclassified Ruminococcus TaxID=2608920 RepID=UPI00210A8E41|nr:MULTISPECIES: methionyl-tRNA formyltransferase [unclassified Ruminococcus]MCQ4022592.1 methionyl-tRNA formyltransferase [Ruminococcus sp. zg-924]MCQ4114832.1 methionyl-tRNA formyltransferase [Ruminococcus sp. zg-921]